MALQLAADGEVLQPAFAAGRFIMAKGVTDAVLGEARGPWHVVVRLVDEGTIYEILRERLRRQRPRVMKEERRFLVPSYVSLFNDVSSAFEAAMQPQWWDLLDTRRTFLHTKLEPQALVRRSVSAPPAIASQSLLPPAFF